MLRRPDRIDLRTTPTLTLARPRWTRASAVFWLACCAACGGEAHERAAPEAAPQVAAQRADAPPRDPARADFVDSALCAECHPTEFAAWRGSHHDRAMQPADASTVLGDFDGATFEALGLTTTFFRKDGGFWVNTEGPDGELQDFEIAYTFGVEPLQQYLVEFPGGRLQCLTTAWDTERGRWFTLYPQDRFPPDDALHWTGRYQNWNMMCADCHSTHLARNYDAEHDSYATTWHELDVSCQACHGPGGAHVSLARAQGAGWAPRAGESGFELSLRRGDPASQLEACAPCHSRRASLTDAAHVAGRFHDDYSIELPLPPLYHADGQVLDEVYVMGSFLQSRMHEKGVACSDCHEPHGLELWLPGDALCLQCHSESAPLERFPTLTAKEYAAPAHHHHPPESDGARCVSCHMPARTFMQVDERHDHSLRIPRPDVSVAAGTPNACNDCHADQTPAWAAAAVREWTGAEPAPGPGAAFAAALAGNPAAAAPVAAVARDPEQPAIVRAAALELLGMYAGAAELKLASLADEAPLVRAAALHDLGELPPEVLVERVGPLLADPVRRVRVAAARALAGAPGRLLAARGDPAYARAHAELMASFDANADVPSASLNRGVYLAQCGDVTGAVAAYERALLLDRDFLPAVFNLSTLLSTIDRAEDARRLLTGAIARQPEEGELRYSLGLLLAELGDLDGAASALREATRRLPDRARVHYNYGLAAQQLGRADEAELGLRRAAQLEPGNPDFAYGLALFFMGEGRLDEALHWAGTLAELVPDAAGPQQLIEELERRKAGGR
jgi:tetratricopeptide (TPR) repeat protein